MSVCNWLINSTRHCYIIESWCKTHIICVSWNEGDSWCFIIVMGSENFLIILEQHKVLLEFYLDFMFSVQCCCWAWSWTPQLVLLHLIPGSGQYIISYREHARMGFRGLQIPKPTISLWGKHQLAVAVETQRIEEFLQQITCYWCAGKGLLTCAHRGHPGRHEGLIWSHQCLKPRDCLSGYSSPQSGGGHTRSKLLPLPCLNVRSSHA